MPMHKGADGSSASRTRGPVGMSSNGYDSYHSADMMLSHSHSLLSQQSGHMGTAGGAPAAGAAAGSGFATPGTRTRTEHLGPRSMNL